MDSSTEETFCVKTLLLRIKQSGGRISSSRLHSFARQSIFTSGKEHVRVRKTIEFISLLRKRRLLKLGNNIVEITPKGMRTLKDLTSS